MSEATTGRGGEPHSSSRLEDPNGEDPNVEAIVPASHAQQRLWFFDQLNSSTAIYNVEHIETLTGAFDAVAAQRALDEIVKRHEAFRTTFRNIRGSPFQIIWRPSPVAVARLDMIGRATGDQDIDVRRVVRQEGMRGFDLERGPLIRFVLIELEARRQQLLLVAHHIVFDFWSTSVFSREFATLYEDFRQGRGATVPEPPMRYSTFVAAQRLRFGTHGHDPQMAYWARRLAGLPEISELPPDRPRPPVQTYRGAIKTFRIPPEIAVPFRDLTRQARATLFMSLFAAFALLLHRYSGQKDLAIGTSIANRGKPELAGIIGFLLNMLVLRIAFDDDPTVVELLASARTTAIEAFDNQDVPFEFLIEVLNPRRDPSRSPLFQTMFAFQPGHGNAPVGVESHTASNGAKFDLTLTVQDAAPDMWGALDYNTDLYESATIDRLAAHFQSVLASMAARPDQRVSDVVLLSNTERHKILVAWNATRDLPPTQDTVHRLFERVAAAQPDAVAVAFGARTLTYGELDRRAAALAEVLRDHGAGADVSVGICMERSLDWIVAIFATLKSGGVIVPLDSAFPPARLAFMMEDSSVAIVLTQSWLQGRLEGTRASVIRLDHPWPERAALGAPRAESAGPRHLAYVVYTSGSTGRPKGVLIQHDSVVNYVLAQIEAWSIGPGARVLQFAAFGFDVGFSEIFLTLCSGAQFCLAPAEDLRAGPPLLRTLRDLRITHVNLPPSALAAMQPEALPDLQLLISGGEPCEADLGRRWSQGRRIVNAYGPTEVTIYSTFGEFDPVTGAFPIGHPMPNTQVYVLDRHDEPVPPGVTGEIHVGGICVARGYLNRLELTREKFIPDRFSGQPNGRLYRTGDLGRFDGAGTLHYLGRADVQLKIRGYRIEPGEIETVMRLHPQVRDALVLGHGSGPGARLVAFFIPEGTAPPLVVELRGFLAKHLPDYMAPAAYIMVETWPKTANGKIDRAALPRPDSFARDVCESFVEPHNALEEMVAEIWRDCLGVAQVGTSDNFFDLGGHSLLLVRVYDRLKETLKLDLSLIDMFRFPTVKLQAAMLEARVSRRSETETLGRTDERAARQNAAQQKRRQRSEAHRHA